MRVRCPHCTCISPDGAIAHLLLAAIAADDLDLACENGLLDAQPCPGCAAGCNAPLLEARDARRSALAARDRHRARAQRLARRKAERDAARVPAVTPSSTSPTPALPSAAAAALARAKAKAAERRGA